MRSVRLLLSGTLLGVAACNLTDFPADLGPSLQQVDSIRNADTLDAQEKRDQLAALGLGPEVINGLLVNERLGNQFGGTLESAYLKVVGDEMSALTADEVQLYGDATDQTTYADADAAAVANLLVENRIDSIEELTEFLDDPSSEISADVDVELLRDVFLNTSTDVVLGEIP